MRKRFKICAVLFLLVLVLDLYFQLDKHQKVLDVVCSNQLDLVEMQHMDYMELHASVMEVCRRSLFQVHPPADRGVFGSAVLIDKERGYLLTAQHVANGKPTMVAYNDVMIPILSCVWNGHGIDLSMFSVDPRRIAGLDCISAPLAEYNVVVGSPSFSCGYPCWLEGGLTISPAIVLEKTREYNQPMLQVAANLHDGMSGGPLIDMQGKVIGINCFSVGKNTPFAGFVSQGYGGCFPIEDVYDELQQVIQVLDDKAK